MKALLLVLGLLLPSVPGAETETAGEVMDACRKMVAAQEKGTDGKLWVPKTYESGFCWGVFAGIGSLLSATFTGKTTPAFGICVEGVTRSDLIWAFLEYVREHPEKRDDEFWLVVVPALHEKYSCPGKVKRKTKKAT